MHIGIAAPTVSTPVRPSARTRLLAAAAAAVMGVTLMQVIDLAATAAPAEAAACINRVVNRYPGSTLTRVRYGKVGIRVQACTTTRPNQWTYSVNEVVTNGSGRAAFLELRVSRGDVQFGRTTAYQRITTSFQQCLPFDIPVCRSIGVMRWQLWVNASGSEPVLSVRNYSSDDPGFTTYRTP